MLLQHLLQNLPKMNNRDMQQQLIQLGNGAHGTVMSRLHRARLALKEEITRHG